MMLRRSPLVTAFYLIALLLPGLGAGSLAAQPRIVINEIMYAPVAPEPEWIEIFNGGADSVHLKNFQISDRVRTAHLSDAVLAPDEFALITKDSSALVKKYPNTAAHVVQVSLPTFNNTGDQIVLADSAGETLDSVVYAPDWGGAHGRSLERFDVLLPSDSTNFGECIDTAGATPGLPNSIRRREVDVAPISIAVNSFDGTNARLALAIRNRGRKGISEIPYSLFRLGGSIPIGTGVVADSIGPLGSDTVLFDWPDADLGRTSLVFVTALASDELRYNDTLTSDIVLPISPQNVVINELMITPAAGMSEWIEFFNQRSNLCGLDGCTLEVLSTDTTYRFRLRDLTLRPKSFGLVTATVPFTDEPVPAFAEIDTLHTSTLHLQASVSSVVLRSQDGSIIDSLYYDASFYSSNLTSTTGVSLERRHTSASSTSRENWGSSVAPGGSTPLAVNSVSNGSVASALSVSILPNPFSPDGDGHNDVARITVQLADASEQLVSVRVYDERGRLRRTLAESQRVVSSAYFDLDGRDDHGAKLPPGLYTVSVQSANGVARTGVVLAYGRR